MPRSANGVDRHLHVSVGAVLEADWHREARGQLAVDLAFDGARADCTPADELRVILAEGRVEKLGCDGHPPAGEIDHQLPREGQPPVDLEAAVEVGIVDQPLPADGCPRLLEIDPHHDEQVRGMLHRQFVQAPGVIARRRRVVDRAGADHGQQAVVTPLDNFLYSATALRHEVGSSIVHRKVPGHDRRGQQGPRGENPKVGRGEARHRVKTVQQPSYSDQICRACSTTGVAARVGSWVVGAVPSRKPRA